MTPKPWLDRLLRRGGPLSGAVEQLSDEVSRRLFQHLDVETAWAEAAREVSARGPVVYVLRNASVIDYLALDHLTRRLDLPEIGYVNALSSAIAPATEGRTPAERLRRVVDRGGSAALFLKRGPQLGGGPQRGRSEGSSLLEALLSQQRADAAREVMLLPTQFVWTPHAERRGDFSIWDAVLGPQDTPTDLRRASQFLLNYRSCRLVSGDPLSLREFLAQQGGEEPDAALVRRLTYALLRKVERQRRVITGPAHKPPDRVREEILRSPKLRKTLDELAGPRPEDRRDLLEKADGILQEMQTVPDAQTLGSLSLLAEQLFVNAYAGVDVDEEGLDRLRALQTEGSVVLLPSHKSHVDYIVLTWMLRENGIQAPVIAAGDNLSFFPAGPLLRRCGAFYIRRRFRGDKLYAALLDAYMRKLLRDGFMIEFFLEGTRSRTGKLLPPMLGLLNMIVSSALSMDRRKLFFVPVSIGYERMMEESEFSRELSGGEKRKEDMGALLKATGVLTEHWGRINIQFGEAIDLDELRRERGLEPGQEVKPAKRRAIVKRLAYMVMSDINRVTAVTPGALVALALLSHGPHGVSYRELIARCARLMGLMQRLGARISPFLLADGVLREEAVRDILRLYVRGGLVEQHVPGDTLTAEGKRRAALYQGTDVIFTTESDKRLRIDFAKNHIIHWLVDRALIAVAHQLGPADAVAEDELRERVRSLSRLFKYEFTFRADADFDTIFGDVLGDMIDQGELRRDSAHVVPGDDGRAWLQFLSGTLRNFLEAYVVAARSLHALLKGPLDRKDLLTRALRQGERMFLQGEIERSEAVSQPLLDNAFSAFVDQGYLTKQLDELALADSFASDGGLRTVEGRIAAYLR